MPHRKADDALYVVDMRFWMPTMRRVDRTNLEKMVEDGITASKRLWFDDAQAVEGHTYLWRGSHDPRTEVAVWRLPTGTRPPLLTPLASSGLP